MNPKIKILAIIAIVAIIGLVANSSVKTIMNVMQDDEEVAEMELYEPVNEEAEPGDVATSSGDVQTYAGSDIFADEDDEEGEQTATENVEEHWNGQISLSDQDKTLLYTINREEITYPLTGLPDTWEQIQDEALSKRWIAEDGSLIKATYSKKGECAKITVVLNGYATKVLGLYKEASSSVVREAMETIGATNLTVSKKGKSDLYVYDHYQFGFEYNNGLDTLSITDTDIDLASENEIQGDTDSIVYTPPTDISEDFDPQLSDDAPVGEFPEDGTILSAEEWEKIKENQND